LHASVALGTLGATLLQRCAPVQDLHKRDEPREAKQQAAQVLASRGEGSAACRRPSPRQTSSSCGLLLNSDRDFQWHRTRQGIRHRRVCNAPSRQFLQQQGLSPVGTDLHLHACRERTCRSIANAQHSTVVRATRYSHRQVVETHATFGSTKRNNRGSAACNPGSQVPARSWSRSLPADPLWHVRHCCLSSGARYCSSQAACKYCSSERIRTQPLMRCVCQKDANARNRLRNEVFRHGECSSLGLD
jgi:hypothetical protein